MTNLFRAASLMAVRRTAERLAEFAARRETELDAVRRHDVDALIATTLEDRQQVMYYFSDVPLSLND
jgi:hypothetical protein